MKNCPWSMRPFPNETQIDCEKPEHLPVDGQHSATLRDYAHPGSTTVITWFAGDRREFTGVWPGYCGDNDAPCTLPRGHAGRHAP